MRRLIDTNRQIGGGYIVRTAAEGKDDEAIINDLRYLENKWNEIQQKADATKAPSPIHRDLGLVFKYIRDILSPEFSAIRINSEELVDQVTNYVRQIQPKMLHRVKYYSKNYPIFEEYGVQSEVDKALRSKVWLKSGGYIVINQTEALVAIDVNTGRYTGDKRLEDTITRINLEAIQEIVHQVRLRDLGGIVVIDFIDMEERKNQQKVFNALEAALQRDRSPTKMVPINEFGLIVLTRKRVKSSLERVLCRPCPMCQGNSWIKSPTTISYEIVDSGQEDPSGLPQRARGTGPSRGGQDTARQGGRGRRRAEVARLRRGRDSAGFGALSGAVRADAKEDRRQTRGVQRRQGVDPAGEDEGERSRSEDLASQVELLLPSRRLALQSR